jgi:hypothetical protein
MTAGLHLAQDMDADALLARSPLALLIRLLLDQCMSRGTAGAS